MLGIVGPAECVGSGGKKGSLDESKFNVAGLAHILTCTKILHKAVQSCAKDRWPTMLIKRKA